MLRKRLVKALLIPAALMVPASTAAIALTSGTADAAIYHAADAATCTKLTGTVNIATESATGTFSGCTSAVTGGTGKFTGSDSTSSGSVTWKNKGKTTMSFAFTLPSNSVCGSGNQEIVVTGAVKSSTGKAAKIKKGQKISGGTAANTADFCWNETSNALTLLKGTTFKI